MSRPDNDDLERRLREAFAARAGQIEQHDLDLDREHAIAARLQAPSGPSRTRRIFTGAGILAAAAAVAGVVTLAIHPTDRHQPVNALRLTATATSTTSTIGIRPTQSSTMQSTASAASAHVARPSSHLSTGDQPLTSSAGASSTNSPRTAIGHGVPSGASSATTTATPLPPALPTGLPQSGTLGDGEYTGPVPLAAAGSSDGSRMLAMPDGTKWQVTARAERSMTVRLTYLSADIEAYWTATLPAQGWQRTDGGWSFPGTPYAVSAITDKGSFTVSW